MTRVLREVVLVDADRVFFFFPCLSQNACNPSFATHSIRNPLFLPHTGWKCFEHTGCMHYASQPSLSLSYRQHVATCLVAQEALVLPHVVGNALDAAHVAHVEFIAEADLARPHRAQHVHPAVRHCLLVAPSGEVAQRAGLSVSPPPIQLPTSSCPFQVSPLSFTYWQ